MSTCECNLSVEWLCVACLTCMWKTASRLNWKNVVTVPLYKRKANKNESKNYREIRLLNMSMKMFDRLLTETVEEVTLSKIWEVQCDFVPSRVRKLDFCFQEVIKKRDNFWACTFLLLFFLSFFAQCSLCQMETAWCVFMYLCSSNMDTYVSIYSSKRL